MQRHMTVSHTTPESRALRRRVLPAMPCLRLRGRWLEKAGFVIGANVRVVVREGVMILEVLDERD